MTFGSRSRCCLRTRHTLYVSEIKISRSVSRFEGEVTATSAPDTSLRRPRSRSAVTGLFPKEVTVVAIRTGRSGVEHGDRTSPQGNDFELAEPTTLQIRRVVVLISRAN